MGFWRWAGEIVGYAAAPFTYGTSLVLAKSARDSVGDLSNQIRGKKVEGDISKSQNYENQLYSGKFDDVINRLEKIEKATGISQQDSIEKIKEIKENNHDTVKDLIDQLKDIKDPARRKEIYDTIVNQTKADLKAMNSILQEDARKLERQNLKTLEEASQSQKNGDIKKETIRIFDESQKQQRAIKQLNEATDFLNKKIKEQNAEKATAKKLVEAQGKTWFQDLNFTSPYLWLALLILAFFGFLIYQNFMKIKSKFFTNE